MEAIFQAEAELGQELPVPPAASRVTPRPRVRRLPRYSAMLKFSSIVIDAAVPCRGS